MGVVRPLLIALLVLRAAGVPAAAEAPCAAAAAAGHVCCMGHQTETGGDTIGDCGCQAEPEPPADEVVVPTPASPHVSTAGVPSGGLSADALRPPEPESPATDAIRDVAGPSPPRLTGSGFRC
jgi:hypothetical protein